MINMNSKYLCVMRILMNNSHSDRSFKATVFISFVQRKGINFRHYSFTGSTLVVGLTKNKKRILDESMVSKYLKLLF